MVSSAEPRATLPSAGRLSLDPDLDFIIHGEGATELTEAGFRRMRQAHSAGFNAVIGIGSREVLRLPPPKLGHAPSADGSRHAIDLTFTANSNLTGCSTGRSLGFAPFKILAT